MRAVTPTDRLLSLDLGSGATPAEGFVGIDLHCGNVPLPEYVDDWYDLPAGSVVPLDLFRTPWFPLPRDSVREVYCSHFVEHLPPPRWEHGRMVYPTEDWMTELWRVCCHNAKVTIIHPYLQTVRAFQDPTHTQFIPAQRWAYYDREWRQANGLDHPPYAHEVHFQAVDIRASLMNDSWELRSTEAQEQAATLYWNVNADLCVTLRVVKQDDDDPAVRTEQALDAAALTTLHDRWSTGA